MFCGFLLFNFRQSICYTNIGHNGSSNVKTNRSNPFAGHHIYIYIYIPSSILQKYLLERGFVQNSGSRLTRERFRNFLVSRCTSSRFFGKQEDNCQGPLHFHVVQATFRLARTAFKNRRARRSRAGDKKCGDRLEISVGPRCVSLPDVFRSDCRIDRVRSRCLLHACNASCIYMHITDDARSTGARQRVYVCVCVCVYVTKLATMRLVRVIHTGCNSWCTCARVEYTHTRKYGVHVISKLECNWEPCALDLIV